MPKRKSAPCSSGPRTGVSLASLDAALDLLACETFTRLDGIKTKFEQAAGFDMDETALRVRWEEAVKRYWVMKSMDDLCCGSAPLGRDKGKGRADGERERRQDGEGEDVKGGTMEMDDARNGDKREQADGFGAIYGQEGEKGTDEHGRAIVKAHPGAVALHGLNAEEEHEWRKWTPRIGDVVLVDTPNDGLWPGKIIDKKVYFIGRTQPKGNHFFPVRIYNPDMEPRPEEARTMKMAGNGGGFGASTLSIKSRILPLSIRPIAPLLSPAPLLSAYNHATCPDSFDLEAQSREYAAADRRAHPGMADVSEIKAAKSEWNAFVNWVMNERRAEKLRNLAEERERRVRMMAVSECREYGGVGTREGGVGGEKGRANVDGRGEDGYGQMPTLGRERTFKTLAPSAFSSPARPAGREAGTEMTDMSRPRGPSAGNGGIEVDGDGEGDDRADRDKGTDSSHGPGGKRQRRSSLPLPSTDLCPKASFPYTSINGSGSGSGSTDAKTNTSSLTSSSTSGLGIFNVPTSTLTSTPRRTSSPFRLRPGLNTLSTSFTTPTRPLSPRRLEKRRGSGIMSAAAGYESPRRGSWTPPRILPSGDETAPFRRFSGSGDMEDGNPAGNGGMWNRSFDFVSPLGSVRAGVNDQNQHQHSGSAVGSTALRTMSPLVNGHSNHSYTNGADTPGGDTQIYDSAGSDAKVRAKRDLDTPHIHLLSLNSDQDATMDESDASASALPFSNGTFGIDIDHANSLTRRHSECLEVVKEEEEEGDWTLVGPPSKRSSYRGSGNGDGYENGTELDTNTNGVNGDAHAQSAAHTHNNTSRERAGSAPCPETPISKGKSVMHVKDKRQRELMMTPTKPSASSALSVMGLQAAGADLVSPSAQMGQKNGDKGSARLVAGDANGCDEDVEL